MSKKFQTQPPRWADRFLQWFCSPDLLEEIQGDAHELFQIRLEETSATRAKFAYVWDILRFLRLSNIRKNKTQNNNTAMIFNYLKLGWRSLLKRKTPSFINIFGLSVAIACVMVAFAFITRWMLSDRFHENRDSIYYVTQTKAENGVEERYGYTPSPLGAAMKSDLPQLANVVRLTDARVTIRSNDYLFNEWIHFVDTGFFEMFSYEILYGNFDALHEPNQVILSKETSVKYFANSNPVGQELIVYIEDRPFIFTVGAVLKQDHDSNSFRFNILTNYSQREVLTGARENNWDSKLSATFVQIDNPEVLTTVTANLARYTKPATAALSENVEVIGFGLTPFKDIKTAAGDITSSYTGSSAMAPTILLAVIGLLMLTLAISNYINIAIDLAARRLKEIGIRKVMGSAKRQLIFQFLVENMMVCLFSLVLGVTLGSVFFIPGFNDLASTDLQLRFFSDASLWVFLAGLLGIVGIASGLYPALYISSFNPVEIFRRRTVKTSNPISKFFIFIQFTLATVTIIAGVIFVVNDAYQANRTWGYQNDDKLVINVQPSQYKFLESELSQNPLITKITAARYHAGNYAVTREIKLGTEKHEVSVLSGKANYAQSMGFELLSGQYLANESGLSDHTSVLVNQTLIKDLQIDDFTLATLSIDTTDYHIVGVLQDFYYEDYENSINPLMITMASDDQMYQLVITSEPQNLVGIDAEAKGTWTEQYPHLPYSSYYQSNAFDSFLSEMKSITHVITFTATLAIILSCMGLYGMVSLRMSAQKKELSIKKVLGASTGLLLRSIVFKQLRLVWVAAIAGSAVAYFGIGSLLDELFAEHAEITVFVMGGAILILIAIAVATISGQALKVARTNPADNLSTE